MSVPIKLRDDWSAGYVRAHARRCRDGTQVRRLLVMATILGDGHRRALEEIIEAGPIPAAHGAVRWRIIDLVQWLWDEFKVSISKQALGHGRCRPKRGSTCCAFRMPRSWRG